MYAPTRSGLWKALHKSVVSPQHANKAIWLVAHFTDTFVALQSELDSWNLDYEIITTPIQLDRIPRTSLASPGKLNLVLAGLIPATDQELTQGRQPTSDEPNDTTTIAMIVVERHPHFKYDDQVESFARSLPNNVEFGYFNSLDDAVLGHVIDDTFMTILRQLGLNDHELITSTMVSRRLKKVLKRVGATYSTEHPADSAREWIGLNSPKQPL